MDFDTFYIGVTIFSNFDKIIKTLECIFRTVLLQVLISASKMY